MNNLEKAIAFAAMAHEGQVDKNGEPYILHPLRVMLKVQEQGLPENAVIAAVLHDVVEDTKVTADEIRRLFGVSACILVYALTKKQEETYRESIDRILAGYLSKWARLIKMADIEDNMSLRRLTKEHGIYSRYARAYRYLDNLGKVEW